MNALSDPCQHFHFANSEESLVSDDQNKTDSLNSPLPKVSFLSRKGRNSILVAQDKTILASLIATCVQLPVLYAISQFFF